MMTWLLYDLAVHKHCNYYKRQALVLLLLKWSSNIQAKLESLVPWHTKSVGCSGSLIAFTVKLCEARIHVYNVEQQDAK